MGWKNQIQVRVLGRIIHFLLGKFNIGLLTTCVFVKIFRYRVQETKEEAEARLKKWEAFLNGGKGNEEETAKSEKCSTNCASEIATSANDSDGTRSSAGSADETEDDENDDDK